MFEFKLINRKNISILFFCFIIISGCSKDPGKALKEAIFKFKTDDKKSKEDIEEYFIKNLSQVNFKSESLYNNGNILYYFKGNAIKQVYPKEKNIPNNGFGDKALISSNKNISAISDGEKLEVFSSNGKLLQSTTVNNDDKKLVKLICNEDEIIYYKENSLHKFIPEENKSKLLLNEKFNPPYKKYYTALFYKYENILCLTVGSAGTYYISIMDLNNNTIQVKNISASSSKINIQNNYLYYIFGAAGSWSLKKFQIKNKSKIDIKRFNDIEDIEITSDGFIYKNNKGLWINKFKEEKIKIPFNYILAGKCKNKVLLEYSGKVYLVDLEQFIDELKSLKEKLPEIFDL